MFRSLVWHGCLPSRAIGRLRRSLRRSGDGQARPGGSSSARHAPSAGAVIVSNSTASEISALYEDNRDARAAGLQTFRVPARRAINSSASRRGVIDEYLITRMSRRLERR